jgi:hypothetical protein
MESMPLDPPCGEVKNFLDLKAYRQNLELTDEKAFNYISFKSQGVLCNAGGVHPRPLFRPMVREGASGKP